MLEARRPSTEVLNYGEPGYGQDQIYLRFLAESRTLAPQVAMLGVATVTLDRIVTVYLPLRGLQTPVASSTTKPRFVLDERGELQLLPNPARNLMDLRRYHEHPSELRELGRHDYWYEPLIYESWLFDHSWACRLFFAGWTKADRRYLDADRPTHGPPLRGVFNESSSGFRILSRIIEEFTDKARTFDMRPVVLLFPNGFSVEASRSGRPGITDPVRAFCEQRGLEVLDATDAFLALPAGLDIESLFVQRFHYSIEGNRVVAAWLLGEIDRRGW